VADESTTLISIEQRGTDLSCYQKTRSSDFRFRSPRVALTAALVSGSTNRADPTHLTCSRADKQLIAGTAEGQQARSESVRLSPSLGWLLVSPFDLPAGRQVAWIGILWLIALALPGGFWLMRARGLPRAGQSIALPIAASVVSMVIVLVVAPTMAGTSPGAWWEWLSALGGAAAGAALARVVPQRVNAGQ
jgi:hypothetical protein